MDVKLLDKLRLVKSLDTSWRDPIGSETMNNGDQASLEPVQTRIDWARKYVDELEEATSLFMDYDTEGSAVNYKQDNGAGRIHVTVHLPNGFPKDFRRIIGGALHQLRAIFDNLVYQLVLANEGTPTKRTAFPVLWECPDGKFPAIAKQRLEGVSGPARATIERLQPFNEWPERPKDTTLWLVDELNNIDKHRIAHLACLWIATCSGTLHMKGPTAADIGGRVAHEPTRGIAEHDATLLDFRWNPMLRALVPNPEMMMEIDISSDVALRSPERDSFLDPDGIPTEALPIAHFLKAALKYADTTVLPAFADEFQ